MPPYYPGVASWLQDGGRAGGDRAPGARGNALPSSAYKDNPLPRSAAYYNKRCAEAPVYRHGLPGIKTAMLATEEMTLRELMHVGWVQNLEGATEVVQVGVVEGFVGEPWIEVYYDPSLKVRKAAVNLSLFL